IAQGEDIDVIEIDGASNTGVENIRELRQNAIYKPARARFKIYIIDEVHMLSSGAFNALLKTLEEPPAHVKFIFATTESNKILPTILSRCQKFDFRNISIKEIAGHLTNILSSENVQAEDKLIRRIARLANGSMRDGLSLLDQILSMAQGTLTLAMLNELLGTPDRERVITLTDAIIADNAGLALELTDKALLDGLSLEQIADSLQSHFRDLMVIRSCGVDTELVDEVDTDTRKKMEEQSQKFDNQALVYYITVMEELKRMLRSGLSGRSILEAAIVRICAADRFSDTSSLIKKLQDLPASAPSGPGQAPVMPAARTYNPGSAAGPSPVQAKTASAPNTFSARPNTSTVSPTTAGPSNSQLNVPETVTTPWLIENWPGVLDIVRKGSANLVRYIAPAAVGSIQGDKLTLIFPPDKAGLITAMSNLEAVKVGLEAALGKILNMKISLLTECNAEQLKKNGKAPAVVVPGARPSQEENNAAACDQNVKLVLEHLGGRITNIEKIIE
ncbi:MAG: DNA polymerase III subunit gamma/tau, partial [Sedimentisphaerales bacterium]|nr:DNA polymerase III subunit gamma/tau [Sedimentisphaerales bacterium]